MADYQKMYYILFNAMSDSVQIMLKAMQQAEEIYISEEPITLDIVGRLEKTQ